MSLESAVRIGESLTSGALWHEGRCTWIGQDLSADSDAPSYRTVGADLYSGTAGIAWFLGHLYQSTSKSEFRRTALGAMRHSLSASRRLKRDQRCAFYVGIVGIAFAAARLARLLDAPELERDGRVALRNVIAEGRRRAPFDLVTGTAGTIAALLVLADSLRADELIDFAGRIGKETIRRAKRSKAGWSWASGAENPLHLTGLSHGAAGIGYALLELFSVTGDVAYREAAAHAFDYERSWFDADRANWADLRGLSRVRGPLPFSYFWCHGAPGIALTRIRAWELLHDERYRDEARAAIQTTRAAVMSLLETGRGGFSLCHGIAGNTEILHDSEAFIDGDSDSRDLVQEAARESEVRARLRRPGAPSFFRGCAGIGYLNLRLHNPGLPSILLLRREQFV